MTDLYMVGHTKTGWVEGVYVVNSLGDCDIVTSWHGWSVEVIHPIVITQE